WSLHFHAIAAMLESLSHRRVLERGYALVRSGATAQLIGTAAKARDEATLAIEFADGEFMVQAHGNGDQSSVPRSKPGGRKRRNQGELF
ncbi:MAG: exodeoxyribonuclease VII large subunit, partial [Pseudomonadota bacterium]